jgi:tetratricopeptide (TPR) repeat protein
MEATPPRGVAVSLKHAMTRRALRDATGSASPEALANERDFLRRSIEDLDEQRVSGEVDENDFAVLNSRYCQRLGEVEAEIARQADARAGTTDDEKRSPDGPDEPVSASKGPRARRRLGSRRARLVIGLCAAGCFVVAATLLAAALANTRLPGVSATGSVTVSSAQQEQETLDRAAILGSQGQVAEAVQLYNQVLRADPNQPNALTYGGWLVRLAGLSSKNQVVLARGDASVARAVKVAPGYPDAHALLGVILYEDFRTPKAASVQFRDALTAGASKQLLKSVAPIAAEAFAAAKELLPPRYKTAMGRAVG